ncbi:MAG: N-acetylglucosamine-6-phosphate deacetylase [Bacillota bacterium]
MYQYIKSKNILYGPPRNWHFVKGYLVINEGKIVDLIADAPHDSDVLDLEEDYVLPGFIDNHTHGAIGIDVSGCSSEELTKLSKFYAENGVAGYLPTLTSISQQAAFKALDTIASSTCSDGAEILGIHMEGPCLNEKYRGAQSAEYLRNPSVDDFKEYIAAAKGLLRLVTLSPELDGGIDAIEFLKNQGVSVNIGHSNATFKESDEAFNAGAGCVSHFLNGMRAFHQHEPSIIGNVFLRDDVFVELICDGFHLVPDTVRVVNKILKVNRIILITDSIVAAGWPDGQYNTPCFTEPLVVKNGDTRLLYTNSRAGSTITLDKAFRNFIDFTGVRLEDAVLCVCANPAKHIGLDDSLGSIEPWKRASLTVLNKGLSVVRTIVNGRSVYVSESMNKK